MEKICPECETIFFSAHGNRVMCSVACKSRRGNRQKKSKIFVCLQCNNEFQSREPSASFCSRLCSSTHQTGKSKTWAIPRKPKKFCVDCEKQLSRYTYERCSACSSRKSSDDSLRSWAAGDVSASTATGLLSRAARRYLIREADSSCSRCGWNEINPTLGYPILTIDHIDGDWRNNYRSNLVVLCFNCHTLTPTFGALNRGTISPKSNYTRKKFKNLD